MTNKSTIIPCDFGRRRDALVIDLDGPDGNAFCAVGLVGRHMLDLGYSPSAVGDMKWSAFHDADSFEAMLALVQKWVPVTFIRDAAPFDPTEQPT